ncbi:hypothetical protein BVRB_9g224800 [Beta vulgaris subsp. vulgaris]|uniref:Uncharacterized protein n=1 Tax=Beta vulgaris subsp. vulgaris TaxID=3555 RepID=A0A0J8B660_BETVV|nr:hypothetical protein BVRB_9g224800 [Beta vulgaris subsp. vulgaris]
MTSAISQSVAFEIPHNNQNYKFKRYMFFSVLLILVIPPCLIGYLS